MSLGVVNFLDTSDSSKLFKYTVETYSELSSLVDVQDKDLAFVSTTTGIIGFRNLKGLWEFNGSVWNYASQDLQDDLITQQAEIQANEDQILLNEGSISDIETVDNNQQIQIDQNILDISTIQSQSYDHNQLFQSITPTQDNSWHTINVGLALSNKIITVDMTVDRNNRSVGVRESGSSLDSRSPINNKNHFTLRVRVSNIGEIEAYTQELSRSFFTIIESE